MPGDIIYVLPIAQIDARKNSAFNSAAAIPRRISPRIANHSDPRTTKLYDRRKDLATLSEVGRRIAFE
jgi:hypothetical protein